MDRAEHNKRQRQRRIENGNAATKKYEKTMNGFIMRAYRNMKSRVSGVQKAKFHLYAGKPLLGRDEFYRWAKSSDKFKELFGAWESSGYDRRLTPSVDRIDSSLGYELENMEWVEFHENCRRGALSRIKNTKP